MLDYSNFSDSIMELDKYFFDFTISVLSNNKKVAILKGTIFDNDLIIIKYIGQQSESEAPLGYITY